jgi:hypothetical protein
MPGVEVQDTSQGLAELALEVRVGGRRLQVALRTIRLVRRLHHGHVLPPLRAKL